MAEIPITFFCPACGIKLTVPGSLAGVKGPCPSCRASIQAPYPAPAPLQLSAIIPVSPPVLPPADRLDYASLPATQPIPVAYSASPPVQAPVSLRPEPRQLPNRASQGELVARPMPEPKPGGSSAKVSHALPRHPHVSSLLRRGLWLVGFVVVSGAVVYEIRSILMNQGRTPPIETSTGQKALAASPVSLESPNPTGNKLEPKPDLSVPLPVPEPELPQIIQPPPEYPGGIEPKAPGIAALEVLEKFMAARSLAERLPLMETQTSEAELAASCLAGPLPATRSVLIDAQEANLIESVLDIYYSVDFDAGDQRTTPQTLLVRIRGTAEPKVVADPFLDMFGGRLAAYARTPTEKSGTFQVIIWAVASCNDLQVRNRENKLTLKLLPRDNAKEIAQAYFGRQSKIGGMLEDGTYSLSYGKAKPCTVVLRWNTEDQPEYPYLEAVDIKTMDWNP